MKKEHYIIAGIALVVVLLMVGVYRLFFRTKAWERIQGGRIPQTGVRIPGSGPSYVPESFPLKQGMKGDKIAQLQRYLKVNDDGVWGPQTSAAYRKSNLYPASLSKAELSQENYYAFQINTR